MAVRTRRGFTLVELLVVITIIGMLMSLLLPAVNNSIEAARQVKCKNRLAQLARAANTYETRYSHYPGFNPTVGASSVRTWTIALLADLERADLYQEYMDGSGAPAPFMELMICPSDPPEITSGPITSFVANAGKDGTVYRREDGVMYSQSRGVSVEFLSGADGASNTTIFSENVQATLWNMIGKLDTVFVWKDSGSTTPYAAATDNINMPQPLDAAVLNPRPSSYHPGGVNVAFCDSHVIFLREDIAYHVYVQLMTPDGRNCTYADMSPLPLLDDAHYH